MSGWATGALLSIFGSVCGNLGVNVQKYSLLQEGLKEAKEQRSFYKQKTYILGLILIIFGSLGDFVALGMVAQSIVAPLGSIALVANVMFAHFWLHETVGAREICGTLLIIIGSTLSVVFGNHSDPQYTNQGLLDLISGGLFISYVVVIGLLIIIGVSLHFRLSPLKQRIVELENSSNRHAIRQRALTASSRNLNNLRSVVVESEQETRVHPEEEVDAGIADTIAPVPLIPSFSFSEADQAKLPELRRKFAPWAKFHPFMLCALSGTIGAQSILFSKCFSVLLSSSVAGDNQLKNIFPWVCFISMFICIFLQLYFMAQALSVYDSLYCVPVFQTFFIFISAMGGAAYFREVSSFSLTQSIMFPVGFAITLSGVAVLTFRSRQQKVEADERHIQQLHRQGSLGALNPSDGAPSSLDSTPPNSARPSRDYGTTVPFPNATTALIDPSLKAQSSSTGRPDRPKLNGVPSPSPTSSNIRLEAPVFHPSPVSLQQA